MFIPTPRFTHALSLFSQAHSLDPAGESAEYHSKLAHYVTQLSGAEGPSEALLLAAGSQHIRRWERPRSDAPEGLSGYKMWRTGLNRFHAEVAKEVMLESGYDAVKDEALFKRVGDLLLKKTLARPPLPAELKDPEMHLFEDCICLVFLALQFFSFSSQLSDEEKMVIIVRKTWAKMSPLGRGVVVSELLEGMPEDLKVVVGKALS